MNVFAYLATDAQSRRLTGLVPAVSAQQVRDALAAAHLVPVTVQRVG